jgi:polyisoprenoid-binding protein YceI
MTTTKRRRWPWFVGGAVIVVILAVVAVPYIYIHFIQADPEPELTFENIDASATETTTSVASASTAAGSTATTAAGAAASSDGIDGSWTVTTASQAGYRVKEILFGQDTDAVGRTDAVTGSLAIAGTSVTEGSFTVDLTKVTSDESKRDGQFQGRIMETSQFPTATFTLTKPIDLGSLPADKTEVSYTATGELNLHGVSKQVEVALTARRNGANIEVTGTIPVVFADYQIDNPSTAGISTQDNGVVEFLLVLAKG